MDTIKTQHFHLCTTYQGEDLSHTFHFNLTARKIRRYIKCEIMYVFIPTRTYSGREIAGAAGDSEKLVKTEIMDLITICILLLP